MKSKTSRFSLQHADREMMTRRLFPSEDEDTIVARVTDDETVSVINNNALSFKEKIAFCFLVPKRRQVHSIFAVDINDVRSLVRDDDIVVVIEGKSDPVDKMYIVPHDFQHLPHKVSVSIKHLDDPIRGIRHDDFLLTIDENARRVRRVDGSCCPRVDRVDVTSEAINDVDPVVVRVCDVNVVQGINVHVAWIRKERSVTKGAEMTAFVVKLEDGMGDAVTDPKVVFMINSHRSNAFKLVIDPLSILQKVGTFDLFLKHRCSIFMA